MSATRWFEIQLPRYCGWIQIVPTIPWGESCGYVICSEAVKTKFNAVAIEPTTIYRAPSVAVGSQEWLFNLCTAEDDNTDHVAEVSLGRIGSLIYRKRDNHVKTVKRQNKCPEKIAVGSIKLEINMGISHKMYIIIFMGLSRYWTMHRPMLIQSCRPQVDNK